VTKQSLNLMRFLLTLCFVFLITAHFNTAYADVIVYDDVTTTDKTVKLKALTKGKFFPAGGKLVEFYVEEKHIGTTLSGSDGYAFLKYHSRSPGIKKLKVKMDTETDEGILLVTNKNDNVLLIEVENTLLVTRLPDLFQPIKGSKEALQRLSKKFRIIYLTTMIGIKESRKWLKDNGFPSSAVMKWQENMTIDELQDRGIRLYAIIASPAVLSEASDIKNRFSFEETEDGVVVDDWDELLKQLK